MTDYFDLKKFYSEEQLIIQSSIRDWVDKYIKPDIGKYFQAGEPFPNLSKRLAEIGAYGLIIPEKYGGHGADYLSFGLLMQELERGDTSLRVMCSIQTSLVMYGIHKFGSEDQKQKYLPKLANGELLSSFGLTEPNFGSNTASMRCNFKQKDDKLIINGSKMWIGNSSSSHIALLWAKDEQENVRGIIIDEQLITNFSTSVLKDKLSFRSSITGELIFDDSEISIDQLLPKSKSIKDAYEGFKFF